MPKRCESNNRSSSDSRRGPINFFCTFASIRRRRMLMDAHRDGRRSQVAYSRWSVTTGIYALPPASSLARSADSRRFTNENDAFTMLFVWRCRRSLSTSTRAHLMRGPRDANVRRRIKRSRCRRRSRPFACRLVRLVHSLISDICEVTTLHKRGIKFMSVYLHYRYAFQVLIYIFFYISRRWDVFFS